MLALHGLFRPSSSPPAPDSLLSHRHKTAATPGGARGQQARPGCGFGSRSAKALLRHAGPFGKLPEAGRTALRRAPAAAGAPATGGGCATLAQPRRQPGACSRLLELRCICRWPAEALGGAWPQVPEWMQACTLRLPVPAQPPDGAASGLEGLGPTYSKQHFFCSHVVGSLAENAGCTCVYFHRNRWPAVMKIGRQANSWGTQQRTRAGQPPCWRATHGHRPFS